MAATFRLTEVEQAAAFAIARAKRQQQEEIATDDLLLGCLQSIAQFGIAQVGPWAFDMEELGVDWPELPDRSGAKVAYSQAVVGLFDRAALIAKIDDSPCGWSICWRRMPGRRRG